MRLTQLTRSHEWWDHKTPQILSLAYATALMGKATLFNLLFPAFLLIFASLIIIAIYASIINDFTDLEIDLACGKSNMMQHLSPAVRWLLILLSLGLVIAATFFIYPNRAAVIFYSLIAVSISLYSFSPVRLKNRGIWGVLSCAAAEHFFPTLFAIAVIAFYSGIQLNISWLISGGVLSFIYGIRSIVWHQFIDRENDIQAGVHTFATAANPASFKRVSSLFILVELAALAIVLFQLQLTLPAIFLVVYLLFAFMKAVLFKSKVIVVVSPKEEHFQIAMLDYYILLFPLSLLIYAAYSQPLGWVVLIIHLLLFYKATIVMLKEVLFIVRYLFYKIRFKH